MRLRTLRLTRYRQFIDETLVLDPYVTVVVGRNDTGKTGLLDHFFDQCIYEGVIAGADRPLVPGYEGTPTAFSMRWEIFPEDYDVLALPGEFGPRGRHTLELTFQDLDRPSKYWNYDLDGREIEAYEGVTKEGMPIRSERFAQRYILPVPRYISVGRLMAMQFEIQPWELESGAMETPPRRPVAETLLLRLAGVRARTREIIGVEQPWEGPRLPPSILTPKEINQRLGAVSRRITEKLRILWHDPPNLTFEAALAGDWTGDAAMRPMRAQPMQTLVVTYKIHDADGIPYYGAGLTWFVTFLVEWLSVEDSTQPLLLLFDEPATPLHPSAQRAAAKLLASVAPRHQVIYSTHSPFMIDWDFPQRIRMLVRDPKSKRTQINNKPYHPKEGGRHIWDPLRSTIGVTLGDVAVISDKNVLVEGITDQILLANASALFRDREIAHLESETQIIPYSDVPNLNYLIGTVRSRGARVLVLTDVDQQGERVVKLCRDGGVQCLTVDRFSDRANTDGAIEDVIGIEAYVAEVNEVYDGFDWFRRLDVNTVRAEIGNVSLGKYLENLFDKRFGQTFNKVSVATSLAGKINELSESALERLGRLVEAIAESLT
jgi:hypothetical protein